MVAAGHCWIVFAGTNNIMQQTFQTTNQTNGPIKQLKLTATQQLQTNITQLESYIQYPIPYQIQYPVHRRI